MKKVLFFILMLSAHSVKRHHRNLVQGAPCQSLLSHKNDSRFNNFLFNFYVVAHNDSDVNNLRNILSPFIMPFSELSFKYDNKVFSDVIKKLYDLSLSKRRIMKFLPKLRFNFTNTNIPVTDDILLNSTIVAISAIACVIDTFADTGNFSKISNNLKDENVIDIGNKLFCLLCSEYNVPDEQKFVSVVNAYINELYTLWKKLNNQKAVNAFSCIMESLLK